MPTRIVLLPGGTFPIGSALLQAQKKSPAYLIKHDLASGITEPQHKLDKGLEIIIAELGPFRISLAEPPELLHLAIDDGEHVLGRSALSEDGNEGACPQADFRLRLVFLDSVGPDSLELV